MVSSFHPEFLCRSKSYKFTGLILTKQVEKALGKVQLQHKILVVDDDPVVLRMAEAHFSGESEFEVAGFDDPQKAWNELILRSVEQGFSLVILDWVLPGLSGLALFNRIRSHQDLFGLPILVLSSSLTQDDFSLLREYPLTKLIQKPFTKQLIVRSVAELLDEASSQRQYQEAFTRILELAELDGTKAVKSFEKLAKSLKDPLPIAVKLVRILREYKHLDAAEQLSKWILQVDDRNLAALTELAKIYHQAKRHRDGMMLLRAASKYSPKNLERLLLMGKISLMQLNPNEARNHFKRALEIDESCDSAKAGNTLATNMESYLASYSRDAIPKSFASMLNMIGITLVRNENLAMGLEQYQSAMKFVSSNEDASRLAFNMALGYFRWKKLTPALEWFQRSLSLSDACRKRAKQYIEKIESMITDDSCELDSVNEPSPPESDAKMFDESDSDEVVHGQDETEDETSEEQDESVDDSSESDEDKKSEAA